MRKTRRHCGAAGLNVLSRIQFRERFVELEFDPGSELETPAEILRVDIRGLSELAAGHIHVRIVEIHIIEGVEGIKMQLKPRPFRNGKVLIQRAVDIKELRSPDVRSE